ncbi:hypothetical protein Cfor_01866 [Coptotermes formosanus]|uniref:Uncharacterized protein n=1 Tax=Coptotermes formosanus TaxID=36987 RepID=A0A6L2PN99_COPFO|nr:hypothetical protein Cfor_01866 [Coptotermes formosanus]
MNDSHVLMVKDNSARTAQFVPELTVKLSVLKYLMLSSKKQEVVGKPSSYTRSSNLPTGIHHAGRLELVGRDREEGMEKQDVEKEKRGELADCCELAPVSEGEEENDEDMLAACINIGMQNSRQRQCQYSIENANKNVQVKTHQAAGISRLQTSRVQSHTLRSGRPSGIPVKTPPNNSLRQEKLNQPTQQEGVGEGTSKSLNSMVVPGGTCCEDAVRTFCDEGTPANISHTGSHSDLSVLSLAGDRDETEAQKEETHLEGVNGAEESVGSGDGEAERPELSDDSSNFSGDNDNILAECIQSGMPKAHQTSRRILAQPGSMSIASSSVVPSQQEKKIPTVVPGVTVSVLPPRHPSATPYRPPTHHLCGLSHSSPRSINKKPSPLTCCPRPKATEQHMPRRKPAVKNGTGATQNTKAPKSKLSGILQGPNMLPQCLAAKDEVEVYAFEGSPNECCDGCAVCLQSSTICVGYGIITKTGSVMLMIDSCEKCVQSSRLWAEFNPHSCCLLVLGSFNQTGFSCARLSMLYVHNYFDFVKVMSKYFFIFLVMKAVEPSASGPHNTGPNQSSEVSVSITYSSESGPRSCVSPLNKSVDSVTAEATAHVMVGSDGSWGDHSDKHDDSTSSKLLNKTSSVSEDVVTVLSRNDSLSSLSVDSFGSTEPTPSEQALLEQCISSGMPKSKSEGGCGKARIVVPVSTKKKISGGVCKIPLAVGDKRQGDGERSGPVIPGVPLQKLELKPVARIHCGSRMGVVGAVGNDIPCPNLQNDVHTCAYDIEQIPKNGVDASAALGPKEMAAGVDESIAAIASIQNLRDHPGSSSDLAENTNITQINSSCVSTVRLANEAVSTDMGLDAADYEKQRLKESVNHICAQRKDSENDDAFRKRTVLEKNQDRLDMKLEVSKGASSVCCLSNKTDSPHESTSDDNNSPYSSAGSPSPDFGSDVKVAECNRNRKDPDAMIASLDHLTEEIVRQVQDVHVQKEKNKDYSIMKQSDTWNEDTSPNDVSFPSMSTSAPLVASFKSEDGAVILPDLVKEDDLMNKISEEQQDSSLTDSHMIEVEAGKLAVSVQAEGQNLPYPSAEEFEHSLTSMNSVDLDAIKPPSMMGSLVSLTASLSGQLDNGESGETREHQNSSSLPPPQPRNNGTRLECRHSRKKSLPAGMMVRRALGNNNHTGSIENLQDNTSVSSSCNSHLDNIKPPSAMEELIDIVDMENSMVSVASITSEVADSSTKEQSTSEQSPGNSDGIFELIKPAASVMAEVYAAAMSTSVRTSSASDCLDNINPPSAFNEVADLADPESVIEPGTETICSDTEMYTEEPGCAHSMEKLDEVDAPDFLSDASRKATPTDQYMSSSADSTPKKRGQLTPKQKRQLAKERYKTYTITAEEELSIKKSDNNTSVVPPQPEISLQVLEAEACGCIRGPENLECTVQQEEKEKGHNKVTPKQRRLEDRQRFQTRVLDKSPSVDIEHGVGAHEQDRTAETEGNPCQEECTKSMHIDTAKQETSTIKTLKQKRAEAKERFQTRTLSEESKPQQKCSEADNDGHTQTNRGTETINLQCSNVGFVEALLRVRPDEIESLLEHDANIVITTLNDSRRRNSESSELPSSDEMLLECETLSLISIESESDQNSSICRFGKRRGSDLLVRESSVTEEPGMSHTEKAFVEEKASEEIEADTEDRESVADSETSQEDGNDDANNDDLPKTRGPRIVKPEERLKQEESADSNCTEDGTPQNNSPKSIRGRRKALYSSPASKKAIVPPIAGKIRSSIPIISGAASNVKPTKASVLRQTGRGTPQRGQTSSEHKPEVK